MALLRRCIALSLPQARQISTSYRLSSNVDVKVNDSGIAYLNMQKPPVNSLNLEMLTDISINLDKLHAEGCKGMILGSNSPKIFSAGLDIMEMYQPDEARLREFWRMLQEVFIKLYGSQMVTMAAITGHAPAGGCLLSMLCDYRVMADGKFSIGLNETLLGIVAPFWFSDVMINTIGHRQTEKALQLGLLYSPQQAAGIGLIDSIVPLESMQQTLDDEIKKWLKIPGFARHLTKLQCRQPVLDRLTSQREADIDHFVKFITKESIQKSLGLYLEALRSKAQTKK